MNSKIINGCADTDPGLSTAGTDPDWRYSEIKSFSYTVLNNILILLLIFDCITAENIESAGCLPSGPDCTE